MENDVDIIAKLPLYSRTRYCDVCANDGKVFNLSFSRNKKEAELRDLTSEETLALGLVNCKGRDGNQDYILTIGEYEFKIIQIWDNPHISFIAILPDSGKRYFVDIKSIKP